MTRISSTLPVLLVALTRRLLCLGVVVTFIVAPLQVARAQVRAPAVETDGRTVALMRFTGDPEQATDLRAKVLDAFNEDGFTVRSVALDVAAATKRLKCKSEPTSSQCLEALGKWLRSNPKTAADFIVFGDVAAGTPATASVGIYDIDKGEMVKQFNAALREGDLIVPLMLPSAIAVDLQNHIEPLEPITPEEEQMLATLDEPEKTPEEIAAEQKALQEAQDAAEAAQQDVAIDTSEITADLKEDFDDFCREGPRNKRESRDDPKDLRPKCSMGPFWGYWQPRAWVALGLTAGALVATGITYGLAAGARSDYRAAVDDLEAFEDSVSDIGDPTDNPNATTNADGQDYATLATEVSRTGSVVRQRAIIGDALLGTTVLLAGVLTIIIFQDRRDAKNYIEQEKRLKAISDLRVGPIFTRHTRGVGVGFRF